MAIQIAQEQQGAVRILTLSGRLDTETAADVELAFQDLLAAGQRHFLVDLSGIGYVSSAGLRVLLALAKKLDGGKGDLKLCGMNAAVRQVFNMTGFSKLFAILPDRNAALGQRPRPGPETEVARHAARLLGIGPPGAAPHPQAAALARAAAAVLGLKAVAAVAPAIAITPVRVTVPSAVVQTPGLMARLRALFGRR